MKRFPLLFTTIVLTAFLTLFLVRRGALTNPYEGLEFDRLTDARLPALETPRGPYTLRGAVVDQDQAPTGDVLIELIRTDQERANSPWSMRTRADGSFEFTRLPAGRYEAHLVAPGYWPLRLETKVPATVTWTLPPAVEDPPMLPALLTTSQSGVITPPVGWSVETHPLEGFQITFEPTSDSNPLSGALLRRATTDAQGSFQVVELVHGTYDIYVVPPWARDGDWPRLAEESRRHTGGDVPLSIRLRSGAIDVQIRASSGAPIPGTLVQVAPAALPGQTWPLAQSDAKGRVAIEHLPPGTYQLKARGGAQEATRTVNVRIGQRVLIELDAFDPLPLGDR